ncbi:major histocompatibility complex class I-related protein 1-like isoform X1 [Ranitomeya variabilis]|uniref:major histocompatibility complex class I-related protein 1-like isoform X1 n=1 Tax=Ranitomeya variabilis TaxID=490064 RepID=UPI004056C9C2
MGWYMVAEVLLLMASARFACADYHSHYFYMTLISDDPTSDFPSFTETRTLDDITLLWYDSDDEVIERRVPWFKTQNQTLWFASISFYRFQMAMQRNLHNIQNYHNHTKGYHILQWLEGCTLYDNGTAQASCHIHYDGKPFMYFNTNTVRWTAESPGDEKFVEKYNLNKTILEENQYALVNMCIPHITTLLPLANCTLNRKEAPVVKVTQVPIDNGTLRVHCRAYGHYPKDISIMWYKNGEQISEDMLERTTLPLLDLTYLTSLSFNVTSVPDDVYTCRVNHSSMLRDFTQDWRIPNDSDNPSSAPPSLPIWAVIAICLAAILIIVVIMFGSVSFVLKRTQLHEPFE